jgi:hypothetical protein
LYPGPVRNGEVMTDQHGSESGWDHSRWDESARDESARDESAWDESAWAEASQESPESGATAADEKPAGAAGPAGSGAGQRKATRPAQDRRQSRPRQGAPGADMLTDFQRWLLRSSAKSMRKELTGQVRRTLGGGRASSADVWDTATHEIPPEVGESPECQWCPICRAARRMRDSGPSLGDQLFSAGDVVASAVADALRSFDSVIAKTTGTAGPGTRQAPRDTWAAGNEGWDVARDSWAAAHGARVAGHEPAPAPAAGPDEQDREQDAGQQTEGPDEPGNRG